MFDRLDAAESRYEEITLRLSDPGVIADQDLYRKLTKEHSELEEIVQKYREYKKVKSEISDLREMLNEKLDKDLKEMAEAELDECVEKLGQIEQQLKILLLPKDPNDEKNVIVEIRGGAGGEEAALFAGVLFRAYSRYAEENTGKWRYWTPIPLSWEDLRRLCFP